MAELNKYRDFSDEALKAEIGRQEADSRALKEELDARGLGQARSGAIPCPFVYANGKKCVGHIVKVEAYKVDLSWDLGEDGVWHFGYGQPRSHYHLFCSAKGNHAGFGRPDSEKMKVRYLPDELCRVLHE